MTPKQGAVRLKYGSELVPLQALVSCQLCMDCEIRS